MEIVLGRGEIEISTGWVSEDDRRRALFIEPISPAGKVGEKTGNGAGLIPLREGGLMLIIEDKSGGSVLLETLQDLLLEMPD